MNIQFLYFKEPPSLLELACLIWSVSNMLALIEMLNKFAPEHCQFVIMVETNRKNATKSLGGDCVCIGIVEQSLLIKHLALHNCSQI